MNKALAKVTKAAAVALALFLALAQPVWADPAAQSEGDSADNYAPGEVIVMFSDGALSDGSSSLTRLHSLRQIGSEYGLSLQASGSEEEAAEAAESEVEVIKSILGNDFTIEDSLVFADNEKSASGNSQNLYGTRKESDDLNIALVSSDTYDTEEMIDLLSQSDAIASVEPNPYIYPVDFAEYSLNDIYNPYLYQLNSPKSVNTGGQSVSDRGTDPDQALSVNAASVWENLSGDENEVVVAVIDTGVLDTHEDLADRMWTNPGNIGLLGEHGYNFYENTEDSGHDDVGHGTHCAGVIAAQANNGTGIAGMAGSADVKIMALKIMGAEEPSTLYQALGSYSYVLQAKQAGVNVVATNNSWNSDYQESTAFDSVIDRLGEAGVITVVSAGNESSNIDRVCTVPVSSESDYTVTVGAADITGEPAGFSNWGKSSIDLFAPGVNVLSTVGYDSYFPSIYTSEELNETTEYYGEFSEDTVITDNIVTPDKGTRAGDSIKQFGACVFRKQALMHGPDPEYPERATYEISLDDSGRYYSSEHPTRLKLTIKDVQPDEEYYFYFPYEKNPGTTGDADTKFSIVYESSAGDGESVATITAGEVSETDGELDLTGSGVFGYGVEPACDKVLSHCTNYLLNEPDGEESEASEDRIMSYEEAEGKEVGIGLKIMKGLNTPDWEDGETHDFTIYIDSIGVSKPDDNSGEDPMINRRTSYENMSGTSMACPAVTGAGALLAAVTPKEDGESDSEYALRIKDLLLSNVTKTEALEDLCSTGGYLDLSAFAEIKPVISDAVCDVANETVTIEGENLLGCTVSYKRLAVEDAEEIQLPAGGMETVYADDGKSIVITNAMDLIGTYTRLAVKDENGRKATGSFFLVNGQNKFTKVAEKLGLTAGDNNPYFKYLVTDSLGETLYGYDISAGTIARFNGSYFDEIDGTSIDLALFDWLEESGRYDRYRLYNDGQTTVGFLKDHGPVSDDGKIYQLIYITLGDEYEAYFGVLDLDAEEKSWSFTEFEYPPELKDEAGFVSEDHALLDGKIYFVGTAANEYKTIDTCPFVSYDIATNTWETLPDLPYDTRQPAMYGSNGKIYFMFGHDVTSQHKTPEDGLTDAVYCYDVAERQWTRKDDLAYIGKYVVTDGIAVHFEQAAKAANGLVFVNSSVDGQGNCFLYNTESDSCEPLYYTIGNSLTDTTEFHSCVATQDGIYYIREHKDELMRGYELFLLPADECAYQSRYAKLSQSSASLTAGQNLKLSVVSGKAVSWKSSNSKVCTVSGGKVTALKKGSAVITATLLSGQKVTCKVKVTTSPQLSKTSITVKKGKTKTVSITGKAKSVKNVYKNTKIAKVVSKTTASKIKVKGLKKGQTTLKITVNGVPLKLKVTVK